MPSKRDKEWFKNVFGKKNTICSVPRDVQTKKVSGNGNFSTSRICGRIIGKGDFDSQFTSSPVEIYSCSLEISDVPFSEMNLTGFSGHPGNATVYQIMESKKRY